MRMVFNLSARNSGLADRRWFGATFQPDWHFHEIACDARLDRRTIKLTKDAIPIPSDQLRPVRLVLPRIADVGENGGQRNDLRLIGKIKNSIDVEHVQELRRLHETTLHLRFILFVCLKRQIQQCLPIA